jgi:hypothetical protein
VARPGTVTAAGSGLNHGAGVHIGFDTVGATHPGSQLLGELLIAAFTWCIWRGNWGAWLLLLLFMAFSVVMCTIALLATRSPSLVGVMIFPATQLVLLLAPSVRHLRSASRPPVTTPT